MNEVIKMLNWSSFQSYKDRKPTWIRLHRSLLDNYLFQGMSDNARALLPMLWLATSECYGSVTSSLQDCNGSVTGLLRGGFEGVAFRLRMDIKKLIEGIKECEKAGFIEVILDDKTTSYGSVTEPLQNGYESVTPETETETETDLSTREEKISLEKLSVDHIGEWLAEKQTQGQYIHHDPEDVLEIFKNYCKSTGKEYQDYVAGYKNAFTWERCAPQHKQGKSSWGLPPLSEHFGR